MRLLFVNARARRAARVLPAIIVLTCAAFPAPSRGGVAFTNIIDSTGPYSNIVGNSLNNEGVVGFTAQTSGPFAEGVFTTNGTTVTTIAQTGPSFEFVSGPAIVNDSGTVLFGATTNQAVSSIYTSTGGVLTTIATETPQLVSPGGATINNAGTVAFEAGPGISTAIYTGNGGALTTIAQTGSVYSGFGGPVVINQSGTVGFEAGLTGGGAGIFTSNGLTTTTILSSTNGTIQPYRPAINNSGTAIMVLGFNTLNFSVVVGNGGPLTTVATTGGAFTNFGLNPVINNDGEVAFLANLAAGGTEILAGSPSNPEKVIETGDSLFGSTVSYLALGQYGLNDHGQLLFFYVLSDGVSGLAVANTNSVPEPNSLTLAMTGLFGIIATIMYRRRQVIKRPSLSIHELS